MLLTMILSQENEEALAH